MKHCEFDYYILLRFRENILRIESKVYQYKFLPYKAHIIHVLKIKRLENFRDKIFSHTLVSLCKWLTCLVQIIAPRKEKIYF